MLAIIDDAGTYASLFVCLRRSLEEFTLPSKPDLAIRSANAKKVALAILKRRQARIFPVESPGGRGVFLLVAVEVSDVECEAVRALMRAEKITRQNVREMLENTSPEHVLKYLSLRRIIE
jgi:hypothetical protein